MSARPVYNADDDEAQKRPFYIAGLRPIQVAALDMDAYKEGERGSTGTSGSICSCARSASSHSVRPAREAARDGAARSAGRAELQLDRARPWGTGKSYVYRETSPNAILISGGKITVPQLFVHLGTGRVGLVGTWDVVAFDEVAALELSDTTVVQILKDYMESGSFARGREEIPPKACVFIGNTTKPAQELVREAHPSPICREPWSTRPSWIGCTSICRAGRRRSWRSGSSRITMGSSPTTSQRRSENLGSRASRALDEDFALGAHLSARDEKAVRKTVSGLLKLLHPHGEWTHGELREYSNSRSRGAASRSSSRSSLRTITPRPRSRTSSATPSERSGSRSRSSRRRQTSSKQSSKLRSPSQLSQNRHRPR